MILPEFKGGERLHFPNGTATVMRVKRPKRIHAHDEVIYKLKWDAPTGSKKRYISSRTEYTLDQLANSTIKGWEP